MNPEWCPISAAPRFGDEVVVCNAGEPYSIRVARWEKQPNIRAWIWGYDGNLWDQPTHFLNVTLPRVPA